MSWDRQITIKTAHELELMRGAGRINAEALAAARAIIRPGVTTGDLNAAAEEVLRKHGHFFDRASVAQHFRNDGFQILRTKWEKNRSEERRVGKECRSRWSPYH